MKKGEERCEPRVHIHEERVTERIKDQEVTGNRQTRVTFIKVRVCNKSTDTGDIRQHANPRLVLFFSVGH